MTRLPAYYLTLHQARKDRRPAWWPSVVIGALAALDAILLWGFAHVV